MADNGTTEKITDRLEEINSLLVHAINHLEGIIGPCDLEVSDQQLRYTALARIDTLLKDVTGRAFILRDGLALLERGL